MHRSIPYFPVMAAAVDPRYLANVFILRDPAARAFGEEDLVAELDRRLHFAALDEVGVGLKNRIELLDSWNLLAVEHTAARLINHTVSKTTKMLDLFARF